MWLCWIKFEQEYNIILVATYEHSTQFLGRSFRCEQLWLVTVLFDFFKFWFICIICFFLSIKCFYWLALEIFTSTFYLLYCWFWHQRETTWTWGKHWRVFCFYNDSFFLLLLFVINFQVFIWKEKSALQAITECKQLLHAT